MKRTYQPNKRHRRWNTVSAKEWQTETVARYLLVVVKKAENSSHTNPAK